MAPILHATAAGNSGSDNDASAHFPSSYNLENIIAVAATDDTDLYAYFSNYGSDSVDLAAPGVGILSTVPTGTCELCHLSGYASYSGTSMATPHVAGAAALIWEQYPGMPADQVKNRLLWNGDYIGDVLNNLTAPTLTNSRLNVFKSLELDNTAPGIVGNLQVPGTGLMSISLSWLASGDDGTTGTASSYDVRYSTSPIIGASWAAATQATGEPSPRPYGSQETFTISGLSSNTTYYTAVKARDNVGNASPMSDVVEGLTKTATTVFQDDMENGSGSWIATGRWHQSNHKSSSSNTSWYYGIEKTWNYDTGAANSGTLTTPQIDFTGATEASLSFSYWREVENWPIGAYDQTYVKVSYDGGTTWDLVWYRDGRDESGKTWLPVSIPLQKNASTVQVRFTFKTGDGIDNAFEGWYVDDVTVIADVPASPAAAITVAPTSGLGTSEAGGTATFTVVLNSEPVADVTINLSSDTTEGTLAPASLTFAPTAWNTPQTVTVTGVDDDVADRDLTYTIVTAAVSTDPVYDGLDPADVSVTNTDDDTAGVTLTPTTGLVTTEDGGTATFTVVLDSEPVAEVTISLSSSDTTEDTVASLTFTPAGWNQAQTVTVTGVDDDVVDGDLPYTIVTAAASTDPVYDGLDPADVSVTNTDDDTAWVTVTPTTGLVTTEASGTASFTVMLESEPVADVTISLSSSETTEGTVSPTSLTFAPTAWNTPQTVTVTGVDDDVADGDLTYTIVTAAVSTDPVYDGLDPADVSVTNTDDDTAGVTLTPTTGLVTTEDGGTATFTVVLDSEPVADVTIGLSSSDTTEGTVSPTSLTFTAANWNEAQTVTVTGVDDAVEDGDLTYTIVTAPAASDDLDYNGLDPVDVSVTNSDYTAGATLFFDNFDDGDLSEYGQLGGSWTTVIESGKGLVLRQTGNGDTILYASSESFSGSYQVKAEIWNEDNDAAGVAFRVNTADADNFFSCSATADSGFQAGIWQHVNDLKGAPTTMLAGTSWNYVRSRSPVRKSTIDVGKS